MPKITDRPSQLIQDELVLLREDLDAHIPAKVLDRNLLIGTWNIRAFGGLTELWDAKEKSPKRDLHALLCIATILSRFDVVAVQEVTENLKALRHLFKLPVFRANWGFIMTDVTRGSAGNGERLAFLFDKRKISLSGLASELVIPEDQLQHPDISEGALQRQFARTPYAVSFHTAGTTFILVTLHVLFGHKAAERAPELRAIAEWMANWAKDVNTWGHNLIALGDFNIDRQGDALYQAFTSTGLTVPPDLMGQPRTIFKTDDKSKKFYDQIAWFTGDNGVPALSMNYARGDSYNFAGKVLQSRHLRNNSLSWRISDHFPLWAEFSLR